jgi:hypothetical protein
VSTEQARDSRSVQGVYTVWVRIRIEMFSFRFPIRVIPDRRVTRRVFNDQSESRKSSQMNRSEAEHGPRMQDPIR